MLAKTYFFYSSKAYEILAAISASDSDEAFEKYKNYLKKFNKTPEKYQFISNEIIFNPGEELKKNFCIPVVIK